MIILGVNFSHDSSLTIIKDGKILCSIEEEKTSRVKQDFGWPQTAVDRLFKEYNILPSQVDIIAFGGMIYELINKNSQYIVLHQDSRFQDLFFFSKTKVT